jgi:hypothetical protein
MTGFFKPRIGTNFLATESSEGIEKNSKLCSHEKASAFAKATADKLRHEEKLATEGTENQKN